MYADLHRTKTNYEEVHPEPPRTTPKGYEFGKSIKSQPDFQSAGQMGSLKTLVPVRLYDGRAHLWDKVRDDRLAT